jgi:hypothetical protein
MAELNMSRFGDATLVAGSMTFGKAEEWHSVGEFKEAAQVNWDKVPINVARYFTGLRNPGLTGKKSLAHLVDLIVAKDHSAGFRAPKGYSFDQLIEHLRLLDNSQGSLEWKETPNTAVIRIQCIYDGDDDRMIDYLKLKFSSTVPMLYDWERAMKLPLLSLAPLPTTEVPEPAVSSTAPASPTGERKAPLSPIYVPESPPSPIFVPETPHFEEDREEKRSGSIKRSVFDLRHDDDAAARSDATEAAAAAQPCADSQDPYDPLLLGPLDDVWHDPALLSKAPSTSDDRHRKLNEAAGWRTTKKHKT